MWCRNILSEIRKDQLDKEKKKHEYLLEKNKLHSMILEKLDPIIYILVNSISLVLATGSLFLSKEYRIGQEVLMYFAMYCSTNTLLIVLWQIALNLFTSSKKLLDDTNVKPTEVNESWDIIVAFTIMNKFEEIDSRHPLKEYQTNDQELRDCINLFCSFVEEFKKDATFAEKNKDEIIRNYEKVAFIIDKAIKKDDANKKNRKRE